ncbi:MAG: hypothetical protein KBS86_02735 [Proteobacteria bacterium]|nr:hypothetical protein [Candidatus Enterousia scatequi]
MWKLLFDTGYIFSCLIPCKTWRQHFRDVTLFGYGDKLMTLYAKFPELKKQHMQLCKGGGSLAFIFDNKIVYKIRKHNANTIHPRISAEKKITDALRPFCKVKIPQIEILTIGKYVFYKQIFIPGKLLVKMPLRRITKYMDDLTTQLANIIHSVYIADPQELLEFKSTKKNGGWVNTDMCSNILINPKTMQITGIIDWEWVSWTDITVAFYGLYKVSHKMTKSGIGPATQKKYIQMSEQNAFNI